MSLARGNDDDDPDGDASSCLDGKPREMGRSRTGLTTRIHVVTDGNATPVVMHLTPGQRVDYTQAGRLLSGLSPGTTVIADKAYGSDDILDRIKAARGLVAIPPKANRTPPLGD